MESFTRIKEYIAAQDKEVQPLLRSLYKTIKAAAPKATEAIKYGIPTFVGKKNLVHFAAAKKHIGFYPTPSAVTHFKKEFAAYGSSKGAVQFPLERKLPLALITKVVKWRVREDA